MSLGFDANYLLQLNFLGNIPNSYTIKKYSGYYMMEKPPKKPEKESDVFRLNHYSYKTEKSYINRIKRYILSQHHFFCITYLSSDWL